MATGHHPAALHAPPFGLASVGQRGRPGEQLSTLLPTSQGGGWRSRPHPDGRSEPAEALGGGPCEAVSACVFAPQFEQENQRLIGEMNSLCDEVRQIEGKVAEISRLQDVFTEKVLQQEADIDSIHQLVVGATENIKEGNEDIREAKDLSSSVFCLQQWP